MDDRFTPRPVAGWFMIAAVASLLFMGLGCVMYLTHVLADPNALPLDQRAAFAAEPAWVTGANAVAVWVGLIGAVLLLMKRKAAEWALLVSVVAVLVMIAGMLVVAPLREAMSANDLIVALVVAALTWTIYWFARHSRQRGWLR
jgi:hypothetical protein